MMSRRTAPMVILIALPLVLCLTGCGVRQRVHDWLVKPEWEVQQEARDRRFQARHGTPEKKEEEPEPAREDFSTYKPQPIPSAQNAPSDADFAPIRLKWLRRISIDVYREMGIRDRKWDKQAEALLEAYAQVESCQRDMPSKEEFGKLADELVATGCTDRLALMAAGVAYLALDRFEEAYANIYPDLAISEPDYPKIALLPRYRTAWQVQCRLEPERTQYIDGSYSVFGTHLSIGLRDTKLEGLEPRAVCWWVQRAFDLMSEDRYPQLLEHLRDLEGNEQVDQWLFHTTMGSLERHTAWLHRGGGFASEVREEGWKGFEEHLALARKHFVKAYQMQPDWPEAPAGMVGVVTGESGASIEGRAWFDRALAGQMDHWDAFAMYIWQLMPRWGGSHEEMWALAQECIDTKRYDTFAPWMAFHVARTILTRDGATDLIGQPKVYASLAEMFNGYLSAGNSAEPPELVKSMWAAIASCTGKHAETLRLLNELGDDADRATIIRIFGRTPVRMRRDAAIATSKHAAEIAAAENARVAGDHAAAIAHYKAVLAASPEAAMAEVARGGLRAAEIERAFKAGKTVDLVPGYTPAQCVDVIGRWEVAADGTLLHHPSGEREGELLFPVNIADDYRITAEIVFPADDDRIMAGLIFSHSYPEMGLQSGTEMMTVDRYAHSAEICGRRVWPEHFRQPVHINRRSTIAAELYHQTFAGYVDGRRVLAGYPMMVWHEEPEQQLLGIDLQYQGNVREPVRVQRVTLEPLTKTPENWADPSSRLVHLSRPWAGEMPKGWTPEVSPQRETPSAPWLEQ